MVMHFSFPDMFSFGFLLTLPHIWSTNETNGFIFHVSKKRQDVYCFLSPLSFDHMDEK